MMRILLAFRVFFLILFNGVLAKAIAELLTRGAGKPAVAAPAADTPAAPTAPKSLPKPAQAKPPARSEALTLLAALQREARFVDLVQESLDAYSDAQIGAAARDVLRDCGKVLDRMFDIKPVVAQPEDQPVDIPAGYDANRFRLSGNVAGQPPFRGRLVHAGWSATTCQLPTWTGSTDSALVIAPAEVEV